MLEQDELQADSEVKALKLALKWAQQDPTRAEKAGPLFGQVRFDLFCCLDIAEWQSRMAEEEALSADVRAQLKVTITKAFSFKLARKTTK